jgi:streptogramin lyase
LEGRIVLNAYAFTTDGDFDQGVYLSLNHNAPNNNQLQLNSVTTPFPFVNIACSSRGTAVRIDTVTGAILGEFWTAPNGMGRDPSRTTVDQFGNVWLSNRAEAGGGKGSITRIGLVIGGTRGNKNPDGTFTPDPNGQYLQGPFQYNTCIDRDADGLIKTSRGLGNILAWTNAGGADTNGGVTTADDEALINYTRVAGTNARTVCIDANNDLWVGGLGNHAHEKISGVTGQPIAGTQFNKNVGGYGGIVDHNGVLWSSGGGSQSMLRYDTTKPVSDPTAFTILGTNLGDYGLGIDPNTGEIWHTSLSGNYVAKISPAGALIGTYNHGNGYAQGVAVDGSGNVWVAHSILGPQNTLGHLRTDGTFVGNITVGSGPTGVAVDANGKIWVANYYSSTAMRIDPNAGPIGGGGYQVGAVDLTVDLGSGAYPYNYSDMTGYVAIGSTTPQGTWDVVEDSGTLNAIWNKIQWNQEPQGSVPEGGAIIVEARAANTQAELPSQAFVAVTNGAAISLAGQYIETRVTLRQGTGGVSPVLSDITLNTASAAPRVIALNALFGGMKYDVLANAGGRTYLPWLVTGFEFIFDQAVIAHLGDLLDTDVSPLGISSMSGSGTDHVTWQLASPAAADAIMLRLASGGVTDLSGTNPLDGNGDGTGGDPFNKLVNVLWGDLDDNGMVTVHDFVRIRNAAGGPYSLFADMDGDGDNDSRDVTLVRFRIGRRIV